MTYHCICDPPSFPFNVFEKENLVLFSLIQIFITQGSTEVSRYLLIYEFLSSSAVWFFWCAKKQLNVRNRNPKAAWLSTLLFLGKLGWSSDSRELSWLEGSVINTTVQAPLQLYFGGNGHRLCQGEPRSILKELSTWKFCALWFFSNNASSPTSSPPPPASLYGL